MIAVKPYFETEPAPLSEAQLHRKKYKSKYNPTGNTLIQLVLKQQGNHIFDDRIYGAPEVKRRLEAVFHKKCAFCECDISMGAHYDVEHFRPKKHYYWLGYEWTNLLISCHKCNRDYKGGQFPLWDEIYRVSQPPLDATQCLKKEDCHILSAILREEQSLLLHPALDNPKTHLKFLKNGMVQGLTLKGNESVQVYGLNRDELVNYRKNMIRKIRMFILYPFEWRDEVSEKELRYRLQEAIETLIVGRMRRASATFIGFTTAIWENFDEFILENTEDGLEMPYQLLMKQIVQELKVTFNS